MTYKHRDTEDALHDISAIDARIARYELAQRITGPEDFYANKIDELRRERRSIINNFCLITRR